MTEPSNPLPAAIMAGLRMLLAALGPVAVQRGWLGESDLPNFSALAVSLVAFVWGVAKTHSRQKRLVSPRAPIGRSTIR